MAVVDRIVRRLVDSDIPLDAAGLSVAARAIAAEEAPLGADDAARDAVDALIGLGPLEALLRDPGVSDVLVNGPDEVWVERRGRLERAAVRFRSEGAIVAAVERVIAPLGLRIDRASPAVDARLADGSRLHAIVPPISVGGPVLAVRRFTQAVPDLAALVAEESVSEAGAAFLVEAVVRRRNVVVSGGTGSGKTTLLNVLSGEISDLERVVTVEDAAELQMSGHVVRLEARPPNAEGAGQVTLRTLVRHALRLRPDRIIVGEVRGPEALEMIQAMSTGHSGSMSTVHANGPEECLLRLETLALSGDLRVADATVRRQLHAALDIVVHMERRLGRRRVAAIARIGDGGVEELFPC